MASAWAGSGNGASVVCMEFLIVVAVLAAVGVAFLWARKHFAKEVARAREIRRASRGES